MPAPTAPRGTRPADPTARTAVATARRGTTSRAETTGRQAATATPLRMRPTAGVGSADACAGGTAVATGPGCQGLPPTCGPNCNASCCGKSTVAAGTFSRCYDAVTYTDNSYTATVSAFPLDTYEVTVGRFRPFVAGYPGDLPSAGAGKNPHDSSDPGWDTSWNALMPPDQATLTTDLHCHTFLSTWSAAPSGNENKPLNCVSWFEAYAFCIWDGGRLPTEAEWNYAAAGGSDQRVYPWSIPPTSQTIDGTYANFDLIYSGATRVGEFSPRGDGRWGQADLAGNVWEWTLDWYANPFAITPCTDCADLTSGAVDAGSDKVLRGASFYDVYQEEVVSNRGGDIPGDHYQFFGFRCAR